ncbi:MAG: hypothetical protein WC869_15775 [Phycisphaerae bacterium]|jgi:hypothetical protein
MIEQILRVIVSAIAALSLIVLVPLAPLPPSLQLLSFKAVLVSLAFVHAHIAGKMAFPTVDWHEDFKPVHVMRISLYVVFVYCYSLGG